MAAALSAQRLDRRIALVTGAGSGIGLAIAMRFAAEGAAVVVNDLAAGPCEQAVAAIEAAGGVAAPAPGDVSSAADAAAITAVAKSRFGGLDVLVNNAGITRDGPLHRMSDESWHAVGDVVLWGAFCMCRAAAPLLRGSREERPDHNRKVINMASSVALHGTSGVANYAAAKSGLIGLTRALGREWAPVGVNVNALAPGLITGTGLADEKPTELIEQFAEMVPLGRAGSPDDVAGGAVFLASADSDFVVGQVLEMHGGLEA